MEGGDALASLLFDDVNEFSNLRCTFQSKLDDSRAHKLGEYPGKDGTVKYEEGLLVGYRWFDTKNVEPLFPFGFGLSYTKFDYSNFKLVEGKDPKDPTVTVQFEITNTGPKDGAEIAQIYVHQEHASLPRPEKELKGFRKVFLKAGEKQTVSIPLARNAFAFYDPEKHGWIAEKGNFKIIVASSSKDPRLQANYTLAQTTIEK